MKPVAVVDIGSNSIKALVVTRSPKGILRTLHAQAIEARISDGISHANPRLSAEGMARGVSAVQELLEHTQPFSPQQIQLVATSAVRDASNGADFQEMVFAATGHRIRILSGTEEANLIGLGLTCDPALAHLQNFYLFDLGGGSLECLSFRQRKIQHSLSLKLGCVRLTEKFIDDRKAPISTKILHKIAAHTSKLLRESSFAFDLPSDAEVIGTGGTLTTARAIFAEDDELTIEQTPPLVTMAQLGALRDSLAAVDLAQRQLVKKLPIARADVFPAALSTLVALAEHGGFSAYHHSLYNLRYGVAVGLLKL